MKAVPPKSALSRAVKDTSVLILLEVEHLLPGA